MSSIKILNHIKHLFPNTKSNFFTKIYTLYTPAFLQGNGGETAAHTGGAERQRPAEWNRLLHAVPPPQGDPWYGLRTEIKNFT